MSINNLTSLVHLVDDEFVIRDSLTLLLESVGQMVRSFESAEAFLKGYDPAQPGCLLLDVRMPLMTGYELQDELLNRDINIPIIFISGHGYTDIPDSTKALKGDAADFLEKPFDNKTLLERINEAIKKDSVFREALTKKRCNTRAATV